MKESKYFETYWFMCGLVTAAISEKYGWWGSLTIPVWFTIYITFKKLINYKPKQRTIKDY